MARPLKEGLDYFPLDVIFDEKIQALESVFKNDGLVWIIKFWQSAYRSIDGEVSLDGYFGVILRENSRITLEKHEEILKLCLEVGLLTKTDGGKYTSNGIKKRFESIVGLREKWRNKHKISSYEVISPIIPRENLEETGESKVNKSKYNIYIGDFFSYYLLKTGKKFRLTDENKKLIKGRLEDGYTIDQLKKAVDNFIIDPWEGRKSHLDLIYCIGKQKGKPDNLEKWLNYKQEAVWKKP